MSLSCERGRLAVAAAAGLAAGLLAASAGPCAARRLAATWRRLRPLPLLERLRPESREHKQWMQRTQTFIFDIDGVIHVAGKVIPGVAEALAALERAGKCVMFMTNNASVTQEMVVDRFRSFGITIRPEQVMISSIAAANVLKARGLDDRLVYCVGMDALSQEIVKRARAKPFGGEADGTKTREDVLKEFRDGMDPPAEEVAAVVVGVDFRFNYYKVARASNYLRQNPDCLFVATNLDPRAKLGTNAIVPAAGVMVEAVCKASGRQPDIVCGKPSSSLAEFLLKSEGLTADTTCMVGDRTDTDILFGRSVGMQTLFVESGSMTLEEASSTDEGSRPRFVAASVAVLGELLAA